MADQLLFDKLAYKDRLTASGISDEQARAFADAMHEALRESVATKFDIIRLEQTFDTRIAQLETKLTLRLGTLIGAATAILIAIKFFGK